MQGRHRVSPSSRAHQPEGNHVTAHPLSFRLDKHKKGGTLQFLIYGDIGMNFFDDVSARDIVEILGDNQDVSAIEVRINSGGGSAFDGTAIYNALRQHPAPVTVFIDGIAASAAATVAMSGTEINIGTGAMIMIHNSANGAFGDNREHRNMANILTALDQQIASIFMDRNGLSLKETLALMEAETWFGAAEAVEAGMATKVVGAVEAVAFIDLSQKGYSRVPAALAGEKGIVNSSGLVVGWTAGRINRTTAPQPAPGENDMKIFAQAAGLPESATEAEIVAKMQNAAADVKAATERAGVLQTQLTAMTAAVGAEGDEALGKIEAGKVALAMVETQTAELATIKANTEKEAHAALVVQGKKDGKLTADLEKLYEGKPAAELKAFLAAMKGQVVPMGVEHNVADGGSGGSHATLTYNGKKYADMDGNEKNAVFKADPDLFKQMSDDYRSNLHPNAAL